MSGSGFARLWYVSLAAALLVIGRDTAKRLPPAFREANIDALLYDEDGLPH